ncbi:DUF2931 family protein [Dyella kyungheensis]|uniref:DUF2931 family protein n=1 Tax=Dyella kyungheensis TaxID=1242174 RepID=UPI003CEED1CC
MNLRYVGALLLWVLLPACARGQAEDIDSLSCISWSMTVFAPGHMESWIEALDVKDDRGNVHDLRQGMAGDLGQAAGWGYVGAGGGNPQFNARGLPVEAYLRWQSLVEPQTYTFHFVIPDEVRHSLVRKEMVTWRGTPKTSCRSSIAIEVAPGGRVVVSNAGLGFKPVEVMRGQAEVEPLGPYQGKSNGKYRPMHEPAQQYVKEHGIPYDSWAPPPSATVVTNAQAAAASAAAPAVPTVDIAAHPEGSYVLNGMMEVDSRLLLKADGSFQSIIELGAAYGTAIGRWEKRGDAIILRRTSPDRPHRTRGGADDLSPLFDRMRLTIDGSCLRTNLMGASACYLRH